MVHSYHPKNTSLPGQVGRGRVSIARKRTGVKETIQKMANSSAVAAVNILLVPVCQAKQH